MRQQTLDEVSLDVSCPTCSRDDFVSRKGVRIHHAKIHGESLAFVEVECDWCGNEKEVAESRAARNEHHFCNNECFGAWMSDSQTDEANPCWGGGKRTVTCDWCGEERHQNPSRVNAHDRHFCDAGCDAAWKSENQTGENNPNWKGGYTGYYGPSWNRQRRRAIERDDESCVLCGMGRGAHQRLHEADLNVHHKIPFRRYGLERHREANRLSNLVTLCVSCHIHVERTRTGEAEADSGAAD